MPTSNVSPDTRFQRWLDHHIGEGRVFQDNVSLATAAEVDEGTIRRIRQGKGTTRNTVEKIASAFGLTTAQLETHMEALEHEQRLGSLLDDQILAGLEQLPEEDKQEIYDLIKSKRRRHNLK